MTQKTTLTSESCEPKYDAVTLGPKRDSRDSVLVSPLSSFDSKNDADVRVKDQKIMVSCSDLNGGLRWRFSVFFES